MTKKEIPESIISVINADIENTNSFSVTLQELSKQTGKTRGRILTLIEKELQLVPINHYRNFWMAVGMSAFGVPLGIAFGTAIDNVSFLGVALPIGMVIGMAIFLTLQCKVFSPKLRHIKG